jgi:hypothetical protein
MPARRRPSFGCRSFGELNKGVGVVHFLAWTGRRTSLQSSLRRAPGPAGEHAGRSHRMYVGKLACELFGDDHGQAAA